MSAIAGQRITGKTMKSDNCSRRSLLQAIATTIAALPLGWAEIAVRTKASTLTTVTLDPDVKDAWGLPAMRVTDQDHPDDLANARFLQDRGVEILEAAGALRVTKAPVAEQTSSMHLMGTCRPGNDPATSVVDRYHRSRDIPNLFVCGSSLVTSGRGQPTMTIQALAFRAGEHIARFAKRGEI